MAASKNWLFPLIMLLCSSLFVDASLLGGVIASSVSSILANSTASFTITKPASFSGRCNGTCEIASWCSFSQGEIYKGYVAHCGLDYYRGDFFDQRVKNVDQCVELCNITTGCIAMSYESKTDDGLNGMCWLKNGITTGLERPVRWIVGLYKADLAVMPPLVPDWFHPASPAAALSSPVWSPSASTSPKSRAVTMTESPSATSSLRSSSAAAAALSRSAFSSLASSSPLVTLVVKTSSVKSMSSAATHSPSITSSGKPSFTADQGEPGGSTPINPPFWFSTAHPCYPTDCSFPVTRSYPTLSLSWFHQSSKVTPSNSKVTATKSIVTTKVLTSSKATAIKSSFVAWSSPSTCYTKPTRTVSPSHVRPISVSSGYAPHPLVSSGDKLYPSGRSGSTAVRPSSSSKGYALLSSVTSVYPPPVATTSSALPSSSKVTHLSSSSKYHSTSTVSLTTVVTKTHLVPSTTTSTVYKPITSQDYRTHAVSSTTAGTVYKPVPSKSSVVPVVSPGYPSHSASATGSGSVVASSRIFTSPMSKATFTRTYAVTVTNSAPLSKVTVSGPPVVSRLSAALVTGDVPDARPTMTSSTVSKIYVTTTSSQEYSHTVMPSASGPGPANSGYVGSSSLSSDHPVVPIPSQTGSNTPATDSGPSPAPTDFVAPSISDPHTPITKSVSATSHWKFPSGSGESSGSSPLVTSSSFGKTFVFALAFVTPFVAW